MELKLRFFYAKIGKGNSLASRYLCKDNEFQKEVVPIEFNCSPSNKHDFLKDGGAKEQGVNFFWCGENCQYARIVVIYNSELYILQPKGDVEFHEIKSSSSPNVEYLKVLPVVITESYPIALVPAVLASLTANAYYYTGTFREIKDPGNFIALCALLRISVGDSYDACAQILFSCLSSVQLETLIAKLCEEKGCFVPAYRGGTTKDVDIFAYNDSSNAIDVGMMRIKPNSGISIQIKLRTVFPSAPVGVDYLITTVNSSDWLIKLINESPLTKRWLCRSLNWLDPAFIQGSGVNI